MTLPPPITSRTNARVKDLRAAVSGRAVRTGDLLGLEGEHLLQEALRSGLRLETMFVREGSEAVLRRLPGLEAVPVLLLSGAVFDSAVSTATPQGVAATWRIAEPAVPQPAGRVLVLEQVQDPGNFGTLMRSAEAFGATAVYVTPGSASQWNPKAVRSSAGSVFRMPVVRQGIEEIAAGLRAQGVRLFAAVASFQGEHEFTAPHGVLFGRRTNAGAAAPVYRDVDGGTPGGYPAALAYDADLRDPCGILIGNEGAGLSEAALKAADERVLIPCAVESLNAAVAGSILLYEAMRQITLRVWAREQGLRA